MSIESRTSSTLLQHTVKKYDEELEQIRDHVLKMGRLAGKQLKDALKTLASTDSFLRETVLCCESEMDHMEVEVDEAILELVARRCPMGSDLRSIVTYSKCASDLEKIGDEAVRIVGFTQELSEISNNELNNKAIAEIERLGKMAISIFYDAIDLIAVWDENRAHQIIGSQTDMDGEFQNELQRLMTYITEDSLMVKQAVCLALVAKSYDRVTHHAQNLAEYIHFEIKGVDVRLGDTWSGI